MVNLIAILFTLFWLSSSDDINASYNSELNAIVIDGRDLNEMTISDYDVSVYFGRVPSNPDIPKIIGDFECVDSQIIYKSKYGFSTDAFYTVIIASNKFSAVPVKDSYRFIIKIPKAEVKSTTYIKSVYPSASKLPMNQLKFYIEFSKPMKLGNAYSNVHLYKMPEETLELDAFLIMPDELWDIDKKRLTILFDPGRIKRGIQPNLQLGLPLVEGQNYKLVIDKDWLDNNGARLAEGYEKTFDVIAVDRTSPNKDNWTISFPEQGTLNPVTIDFKESMDYGLMQSAIVIVDKKSKHVQGKINLKNHENTWSFTPKKHWTEGDYTIVIDAWLEDLAGNSLRRKFDVDLNSKIDNPKNIKEIIIPFKIN